MSTSAPLRQLERRHPVDHLAGKGEGFPTRGDDSDAGTPGEHLLNEGAAGVQQVFAVVHDQQQRAGGELLRESGLAGARLEG